MALVEIAANIKFSGWHMSGSKTNSFHTRNTAESYQILPKMLWLALVGLYNKEVQMTKRDTVDKLLG